MIIRLLCFLQPPSKTFKYQVVTMICLHSLELLEGKALRWFEIYLQILQHFLQQVKPNSLPLKCGPSDSFLRNRIR